MIYELSLAGTPPSFNKVGHTGNRWTWTRAKKEWQETLETALLAYRVPRGLDSVRVTARLRFPQRRKRDEGNFRTLLEKCLGDALVNGGWLSDDTPDEFEFGRVVFEEETGPARTTLILETP
jgi:hypothetical protein